MLATRMREAAAGVGGDDQYYVELTGDSGSYINCGSDSSLDDIHHGGAITWEAWIYIDSDVIANGMPLAKTPNYGLYGPFFHYSMGTSKILFCVPAATTNSATALTNISTGAWHHIAGTYDDNGDQKARLFIDGGSPIVAANAISGALDSDASYAFAIGANSYGSLNRLDGRVAWSRISDSIRYTTSFTPDAKDSPPAVDGNTVEQWNLNDGSGSTASAEVSGSNDGTITDGSWTAF